MSESLEPVDGELVADTLTAARALASAHLDPCDAVHDAANLQEMLAFVIEQLDERLAGAEISALRSAASDLETGLDGIDGAGLQRAATAVAIAAGWLRRRAERLATEVLS